jgi:hypothetical protein
VWYVIGLLIKTYKRLVELCGKFVVGFWLQTDGVIWTAVGVRYVFGLFILTDGMSGICGVSE